MPPAASFIFKLSSSVPVRISSGSLTAVSKRVWILKRTGRFVGAKQIAGGTWPVENSGFRGEAGLLCPNVLRLDDDSGKAS